MTAFFCVMRQIVPLQIPADLMGRGGGALGEIGTGDRDGRAARWGAEAYDRCFKK